MQSIEIHPELNRLALAEAAQQYPEFAERVCAPIATANQPCQCESNPLGMKNWCVHPGSAPSRQTPSAPARTATGGSKTANIDSVGFERVTPDVGSEMFRIFTVPST